MPDLPSCSTFFCTLRVRGGRGGAKTRILGNHRDFDKNKQCKATGSSEGFIVCFGGSFE